MTNRNFQESLLKNIPMSYDLTQAENYPIEHTNIHNNLSQLAKKYKPTHFTYKKIKMSFDDFLKIIVNVKSINYSIENETWNNQKVQEVEKEYASNLFEVLTKWVYEIDDFTIEDFIDYQNNQTEDADNFFTYPLVKIVQFNAKHNNDADLRLIKQLLIKYYDYYSQLRFTQNKPGLVKRNIDYPTLIKLNHFINSKHDNITFQEYINNHEQEYINNVNNLLWEPLSEESTKLLFAIAGHQAPNYLFFSPKAAKKSIKLLLSLKREELTNLYLKLMDNPLIVNYKNNTYEFAEKFTQTGISNNQTTISQPAYSGLKEMHNNYRKLWMNSIKTEENWENIEKMFKTDKTLLGHNLENITRGMKTKIMLQDTAIVFNNTNINTLTPKELSITYLAFTNPETLVSGKLIQINEVFKKFINDKGIKNFAKILAEISLDKTNKRPTEKDWNEVIPENHELPYEILKNLSKQGVMNLSYTNKHILNEINTLE